MSMKKVVSHGAIYAVGNIARNVASFVMLPIYTRFLTPADYGVLELLSMVVDFAGLLLGRRVAQGIYRQYFLEDNDENKKCVISSSIYISIAMNVVAVVLVIALSGYIASVIFGDQAYQRLIILFSVSILLGALFEIGMVYLRIQQRPWFFVSVSISKLLLQVSLNIYFIIFLGMAVEGIVYSTLITMGVFSIFTVAYCFYHVGFRFRVYIVKQLVSIGWPLLLASWISFYVMYADRYFIRVYSGLSEVGVYSLAFKLAFVLTFLVSEPFQHIWSSLRYEIYKDETQHYLYRKIFVLFSALMIIAGLLISLFSEELLIVMSDEAFHGASVLVPYLVVVVILQSLASFCNLGLFIEKKTIHLSYAMFIAAIISTIGFIYAIPLWGAHGAAITILLAFVVRLIYVHRASLKLFNMDISWRPIMLLFFVAGLIYILSTFVPQQLIMSIPLKALLVVLFLILILKLPIFDEKYKQIFIKILKDPRKIRESLG